MIVTNTDIQNAILTAKNAIYSLARSRVASIEQGQDVCYEDYLLCDKMDSYISVLQRVDLGDEDGCIVTEDVWNIISSINGNSVLADLCLAIPNEFSNPGGSSSPVTGGCVTAVLGPLVNNSNPRRPYVSVAVDGVTITGDGSPGNPLVASGGGGGATFATQIEVNAGTVTNKVISPKTFNDSSQLSAKAPIASPTFTGTVTAPTVNVSGLTASELVATDGSKNLQSLAVATYPSLAELAFVKGLTSAVQTQIDGKQNISVETTGSFTAALNQYYINTANATYTDPAPAPAKGFIVFVRSGTATVGGTAYSTQGTLIYRYFHSGTWLNFVLSGSVNTGTQYRLAYYAASGTSVGEASAITAARALISDANGVPTHSNVTSAQLAYLSKRLAKTAISAAHTGTTANTWVDGLLIPANTFGAGDIINIKSRVNKSTSVSTYTHRLYVNTVNSLAGSPILIATAATSAAANRFQQISREIEIMVTDGTGAGTEVMVATAGSTQDDVQQTDITTCAINWTLDQYIVCAIQLANSGDSIVNHFIRTV